VGAWWRPDSLRAPSPGADHAVRLVLQHAAGFIGHTEASTASELPPSIRDEFDAYLECGILAHGVLRLRSDECRHDKLLAFTVAAFWAQDRSPLKT
jgi:hypothetical protein